jgi:hypothetical protein
MPRPKAVYNAAIARHEKLGDKPAAEEARRSYYAEVLAEKITEVVAKAPPLTPEQFERLRALLAPPANREAA